jgi:hypothetical protein
VAAAAPRRQAEQARQDANQVKPEFSVLADELYVGRLARRGQQLRDVLYLGYGTRTLQAIAAATGHLQWTRQLRASPGYLAAGSNAVYAVDQNGGVYAVQA